MPLAAAALPLVVVLVITSVDGAEDIEATHFFEDRIRPVLVEHCYSCHSEEAKELKGELRVDLASGLRDGGTSGPAVIPGDAESSLLIRALRYEEFEMPPRGKLADHVIADFIRWIDHGAFDPRAEGDTDRDVAAPRERKAIDIEEGRSFWSYQPIVAPSVPHGRNANRTVWGTSAIDRFIEAGWRDVGLKPSADASPHELMRRVAFDLTGLPPAPEIARQYEESPSASRLAKVIDYYLASPWFGQRWGQHWLDVARFAESSGGGRSLMFPEAWRFRDYVIDVYNRDVPFPTFVREQLAGDLLPPPDSDNAVRERDRRTVATGFLALGAINYELQDKELLVMEVVDEQIEVVGRAFLAQTIGCARCHDHKFDPIPMTDYYGLAGIFTSTQSLVPGNVSGFVTRPLASEPYAEAHRIYQDQKTELDKKITTLRGVMKKLKSQAPSSDDEKQAIAGRRLENAAELSRFEKALKALEATKPPGRPPVAMCVVDQQTVGDTHLLVRGTIRQHGPLVGRRFLSVATNEGVSDSIGAKSSGRLALANWIANRTNPLAARVYVNRIWQHLLGRGIVPTPDNFGATGQRPSHPELLDFLATRFIEQGWSTKRLVRDIMLSRVYRLSSRTTPEQKRDDAANRWLARANRRRLDAESLRDSMLLLSDKLDPEMNGLTIRKITAYDMEYEFNSVRRSIYVPRFRNETLDIFRLFDIANPNITTGRRSHSTLPAQALFMVNSPFVVDSAAGLAQKRAGATRVEQIDSLFQQALGRPAEPPECQVALALLDRQDDTADTWTRLCQLILGSVEFRYLR